MCNTTTTRLIHSLEVPHGVRLKSARRSETRISPRTSARGGKTNIYVAGCEWRVVPRSGEHRGTPCGTPCGTRGSCRGSLGLGPWALGRPLASLFSFLVSLSRPTHARVESRENSLRPTERPKERRTEGAKGSCAPSSWRRVVATRRARTHESTQRAASPTSWRIMVWRGRGTGVGIGIGISVSSREVIRTDAGRGRRSMMTVHDVVHDVVHESPTPMTTHNQPRINHP